MSTNASSTTLGAVFSNEPLTITSVVCSNVSVPAVERTSKEQAVLNCVIDSDLQCTISFWLYAVSLPTLIVGGTVGNALTIVVMATKAMGKTAFGTYIAAIALADILVLWTTLPRHFIRWIWLIDIRELNQWSCRILRFLQFSLMNTSAWLLVAVTIERFLSIYYPTKFRQYKTRSRAMRVVAGVAAVHFAWNLHIFWTLGEQSIGACATRQCGYPSAAEAYYWTKVHVWVDLSKLSLLPFVVMLSLNVAIVVSLRRRAAAKRCNQVHPWHKRIRATLDVAGGIARACAKQAGEGRGDATAATSSSSARADNTKTLMLLWVSFFYVVTTVPTFVSTVLDNAKIGPPLLSSVATVVLYVNNAANFLLYSLSGATFRRLLVATLKRRQPSVTWSSSTVRRSATALLTASFADQTARTNGVGGWPSPQQRRQPPLPSLRPSPLQQRAQCQPLPQPDIIAIVGHAAHPVGDACDCDSQYL